eukprot:1240633-Rhodomonas_salina.1
MMPGVSLPPRGSSTSRAADFQPESLSPWPRRGSPGGGGEWWRSQWLNGEGASSVCHGQGL